MKYYSSEKILFKGKIQGLIMHVIYGNSIKLLNELAVEKRLPSIFTDL